MQIAMCQASVVLASFLVVQFKALISSCNVVAQYATFFNFVSINFLDKKNSSKLQELIT